MSTPEKYKRKAVLTVNGGGAAPTDSETQKAASVLTILRDYYGYRAPLSIASSLALLHVTGILDGFGIWCRVSRELFRFPNTPRCSGSIHCHVRLVRG